MIQSEEEWSDTSDEKIIQNIYIPEEKEKIIEKQ